MKKKFLSWRLKIRNNITIVLRKHRYYAMKLRNPLLILFYLVDVPIFKKSCWRRIERVWQKLPNFEKYKWLSEEKFWISGKLKKFKLYDEFCAIRLLLFSSFCLIGAFHNWYLCISYITIPFLISLILSFVYIILYASSRFILSCTSKLLIG